MVNHMCKWSPIETAPKDGTEIILAGQWLSGTWEVKAGSYLVKRFTFAGQGQPTKWQPLPDPPKETTE